MNFNQIKDVITHLIKNCECQQCKGKYTEKNIEVLATTKIEGLFELNCKKCKSSTIVNILITKDAKIETAPPREKGKISQDDVLDIKNFLSRFDGNFKKIFTKK